MDGYLCPPRSGWVSARSYLPLERPHLPRRSRGCGDRSRGQLRLSIPITYHLLRIMLKYTSMEIKTVSTNRKARFEYFIEETLEAGLVLRGTEIKSVRTGQISLQEAYVRTDGKQAWLVGAHIAPYEHASASQHAPDRERKLLLHKRQIADLWDEVRIKGKTIVPIKAYLKGNRAKLEIGVAKGKKGYDKRESIKEKDLAREISRGQRDD
jgi:SsrA-binding protein